MISCTPSNGRRFMTSTTTSSAPSGGDDIDNDDDDDDDRKHVKVYELVGETMKGNKSGVKIVTDTNHTMHTDLPKTMGGKDAAPQPVEMLLGAWMGCTQATALFVGRRGNANHRLSIDRIVYENIRGERDERGALALPIDRDPPVPSRLTRITGRIVIYRSKGGSINRAELDLLREQTELRCPIANMMIASGCQMDVEWVCGNSN